MSLFFTFIVLNALFYTKSQIYECPNYELINHRPHSPENKRHKRETNVLQCNQVMINPKKVINRYKNDVQNSVQAKPFGSICLKCSMCLIIAKEIDKVFQGLGDTTEGMKYTDVMDILMNHFESLCSTGFENYDLRKFKDVQVITDQLACSTHVRTKMDGTWTRKLREMCATYLDHLDIHYLFNEYSKGNDISKSLCRNNGIFRDCNSLSSNTSADTERIPDIKC